MTKASCLFLSNPSLEGLRDQGLSKVRHAPACLLGPGAPQTDTGGLSPAFGTKSEITQKGGEAGTVGLSLFSRVPEAHKSCKPLLTLEIFLVFAA